MSDDLIRRSDAIQAVKAYLDLCCLTEAKFHRGAEDYNEGISKEIFEEIEPKRGEWIVVDTEVISVPVYWNKEQKESDEKGAGIQEKCKCSVCGRKVNFMGYKKLGVIKSFNFCPNCGAKMKGADDE